MSNWWDTNIESDLSQILIQFQLTLSGKKVERDWRKDCRIDYEHLEDSLEEMPSIYAFWTAVLSEARKKLRTVEMNISISKSKILRGISAPEGIKLTVVDKENFVNLDKNHCTLQAQYIELQATVDKLFGIVDSLKMKSDNLRSLAGFKKAELNNS